jgi:hypothetical protein
MPRRARDLEDPRGAINVGLNLLELVLSTARPENIRALVSAGRVLVCDDDTYQHT